MLACQCWSFWSADLSATMGRPHSLEFPMSLTLHRFPLSGHAHRAELLLSLLGLKVTLIDVDLRSGAHKQPAFLKLNRFGQVPAHQSQPDLDGHARAPRFLR